VVREIEKAERKEQSKVRGDEREGIGAVEQRIQVAQVGFNGRPITKLSCNCVKENSGVDGAVDERSKEGSLTRSEGRSKDGDVFDTNSGF
jgi:hypothetical protein